MEENVVKPLEENTNETVNKDLENALHKKNKKKIDKKIYIMIGIIVSIIIIISCFILFYKEEKPEPDYTLFMEEYGEFILENLENYVRANHKYPQADTYLKHHPMEGYEVECEVVEIHEYGVVHLDKCTVNHSKKLYSYSSKELTSNEILEEYAMKKKKAVEEYIEKNESLPTNTLKIEYFLHAVTCEQEEYYSEDNIYLGNCTIDHFPDTYSYGTQLRDGNIVFKGYKNQEYTIECKTKDCKLYDVVDWMAIVDEGDLGYYTYNYTRSMEFYNIPKDYEVALVDKAVNSNTYRIALKNKDGKEAIVDFIDKRMIIDYGKYQYDWSCTSAITNQKRVCAKYEAIKVKSDNQMGLVSYMDGDSIFLSSTYTNFTYDRNMIYPTVGGKMGLIYYDINEKKIDSILNPKEYDKVEIVSNISTGNKYFIKTYKNNKVGLLLFDKESGRITVIISPKEYEQLNMIMYDYTNKDKYLINVSKNQKAGLLSYNQEKNTIATLLDFIYDDITYNFYYGTTSIIVHKNGKQGLMKIDEEMITMKQLIAIEYDSIIDLGNKIYAKKGNDMYIFNEIGEKLLGGKAYQAIQYNNDGETVMVFDGKMIQLLDIEGNFIKNLHEVDLNKEELYRGWNSFCLIKFQIGDNYCIYYDYDVNNQKIITSEGYCSDQVA